MPQYLVTIVVCHDDGSMNSADVDVALEDMDLSTPQHQQQLAQAVGAAVAKLEDGDGDWSEEENQLPDPIHGGREDE